GAGAVGAQAPAGAPEAFPAYANQWRLSAPLSASKTTTRRLPLSATKTSLAAAPYATAAGRFSVVWLSAPSILPGVPIVIMYRPARENFSTCASAGTACGPPRPVPPGAAPRPASPGAAPRPAPPGATPSSAASAAAVAAAPLPRPAAAGAGSSPAAVIHTLPFASTAMPPGTCGH